MPSTINTKYFLLKVVNKCPIVPSSKLDRTIKAIINSLEEEYKEDLLPYLNKLRIIYYLRRLEYKDSKKAKEYKDKSTFFPFTFNKTFTNFFLDLISKANKRTKVFDLDYIKELVLASFNPSLLGELERLNYYLLLYSILFKDNSKYLPFFLLKELS